MLQPCIFSHFSCILAKNKMSDTNKMSNTNFQFTNRLQKSFEKLYISKPLT